MKYVKYLLILLLIPFIVFAEDCDVSKITITSMEQNSIEGNTEVISEPTFRDRNINLNLKMYDVGDSITYDMTIKNDSDEDYMIDEDTFKTDSDYIEYSLVTNDNSNVVKAKSSKSLALVVTYKKEVDDNLLSNNKYNASNNLKLSMNTKEKVKELDIITTDNIKESVDPVKVSNNTKIDNPLTSSIGIKTIVIIILTVIAIIILTIINKKKYNKYLILLLSITLLPVVYAVCKCDIEVESIIEIEKIPKLFDTIVGFAKEENACVTKYEGEVTDEVGKTVPATNVYFNKCVDKRNIIFGGFCWQVIRTTETGGIKMIYNGEPVDGKCESTRGNHKGIVSIWDPSNYPPTEYLYGSSFTYNISTKEFTLVDTFSSTWSDSTYEDLIGKFTCRNASGTCTVLYSINGYINSTRASADSYDIEDINYSIMGMVDYNSDDSSPAKVGYMFNKVYKYLQKSPGTMEYKFGNTFTYENGTYTLSGTTQNIGTWSTGYNTIDNTHYTCWNTNGICNTISYIYYTSSSSAYYIDISDGKNIEDALNEMLYDNDVNRYNSNIKALIDSWYAQNLASKTNMLEDTVFCNSRDIKSLGGLEPNGGETYPNYEIKFKNYDLTTDMICMNKTDQFAVNNIFAKLTYPIGLLQGEEMNNINNQLLLTSGSYWWLLSPSFTNYNGTFVNVVSTTGRDEYYTNMRTGVRPVISLKSSNKVSSGTGSETDPWIIE